MEAIQKINFTTQIKRLESLKMYYLEINQAVIQQLGGSLKVRLWCSVNEQSAWQGGLVALGEGMAYLSINTKRMKDFGVKLGDQVAVCLWIDDSEYGIEMPEELSEVLAQDEMGNQRFHQLSKGMQRYIINFIGTVKNSQLRIDKAIFLINNLKKLPLGKETFRQILGKDN